MPANNQTQVAGGIHKLANDEAHTNNIELPATEQDGAQAGSKETKDEEMDKTATEGKNHGDSEDYNTAMDDSVGLGGPTVNEDLVVVRSVQGREYTTVVTAEGFAVVWEDVLAQKLYGEGWSGTVTVREEGESADLSSEKVDDRMGWALKAGSYVAEGIVRRRMGVKQDWRAEGAASAQPRPSISARSDAGLANRRGCSKARSGRTVSITGVTNTD